MFLNLYDNIYIFDKLIHMQRVASTAKTRAIPGKKYTLRNVSYEYAVNIPSQGLRKIRYSRSTRYGTELLEPCLFPLQLYHI